MFPISTSKCRSSTIASKNVSYLVNYLSTITPLINTPKENQTITLSDGRTLGFAEYGSPAGKPLLYFHGLPGSRYEGAFHSLGLKYNTRILAIDRPGIGLSTFQPGRRLLDWPSDVSEFTRKLGLDEYRILGKLEGGPYALACARKLPRDQLKRVGILAGFAPFEVGKRGMPGNQRMEWNIRKWIPGLGRLYTDRIIMPAVRDPDPTVYERLIVKLMKQKLNERDMRMFTDERTRKMAVKSFRECFRQGSEGYVYDSGILTRPWGFDVSEIGLGVRLWCGDGDLNAPIFGVRWMADRIQGSVLREWKGETHFTLRDEYVEEVIKGVIE